MKSGAKLVKIGLGSEYEEKADNFKVYLVEIEESCF